jgi:hypothetical protein
MWEKKPLLRLFVSAFTINEKEDPPMRVAKNRNAGVHSGMLRGASKKLPN